MYSIQEQGPQGRQAAMLALRSITNEERESQVPVLRPNVAIVEPNSDSIEEQDVQVAVQETQPSRGNQPRPRNSDSIEEQGSQGRQAAVQESRPKRKPKLRGRARAKNRRAKKRKAKSKTKQNRARKARAMKDRAGALVNMTRTLRVRVWFMRLGSDWIVFLII